MRQFLAVAFMSAVVVAGCGSDDSDTSVRRNENGSAAAGGTTVVAANTPVTTGPVPTAAPSTLFADSLVVFQAGGHVQTVLPDGSSSGVVTSQAPSGQEHPDWSPDGSSIVFETKFSQLWTVNVDGSDLATRYECVSPCQSLQDGSWSPDGTEIAFMVAESVDGSTTSRSAIVVLSVATGEFRTIYEDTSGTVWLFHPRWSGDGQSIVFEEDNFSSNLLTEEEITSMAVAVVPAHRSTTPQYLATLTGPFNGPGSPAPDWSPVDDIIVFSRADNLFTIRTDGSGQLQVTDFDGVHEHAIQPTFTPDGSAIVFTYVTGTFDVDDSPTAALIELDGTGRVTVDGGGRMTHPRLQP